MSAARHGSEHAGRGTLRAILGVSLVVALATALVVGVAIGAGLVPGEGHLACDAAGQVWDARAEVCRESDSPLSGAAL
ncbi:MAG: hypothetical protein ACFBSD_14430 [Paracoccaceae bacterium]